MHGVPFVEPVADLVQERDDIQLARIGQAVQHLHDAVVQVRAVALVLAQKLEAAQYQSPPPPHTPTHARTQINMQGEKQHKGKATPGRRHARLTVQ
jgi:hypothetical protein